MCRCLKPVKGFLPVIYVIAFFLFTPCVIRAQSNQTVAAGTSTSPENFPPGSCVYKWTNSDPSIGLAASGAGNIPSFTAVNNGNSTLIATIKARPVPPGFAYIANFADGTISVINTVTNSVESSVTVGAHPNGVSVSPDGGTVYVANEGAGSVSVISTSTNTVLYAISLGVFVYPFSLLTSPDGKHVYVANQGTDNVSVINTVQANQEATIPLSGLYPYGMCISPDGGTLYVSNVFSNNVSVINTATNAVATTIQVGKGPEGIAINKDGSRIYVANSNEGTVSVINTGTGVVVNTIQVGTGPNGVAISPDGNTIYVTNSNSNSVSIINTSTNTVTNTVTVGATPKGISVSPDGSSVYAVNYNGSSVSVIDAATKAVSATIPVKASSNSFGNFVRQSGTCNSAPVTFTITVTAASAAPVITTAASLSALNTIYGTPSASSSFSVSGSNLTEGILVAPPAGFEVSVDNAIFSNTITIVPGASPIKVYIRLSGTAHVGNYTGNIVLSSAGAVSVNISVPESSVNPAALSITADNKTKTYGSPNPVLTATYSGFVNGDNVSQLTTPPQLSTTATVASQPGDYAISINGAVSTDYTFNYFAGILTIKTGSQKPLVPNVFTPNGDGINDHWDIKFPESYLNNVVYVYNRYGERVYSTNNYSIPWDGTRNGTNLPDGTYYYIINSDSGQWIGTGFVTIIR